LGGLHPGRRDGGNGFGVNHGNSPDHARAKAQLHSVGSRGGRFRQYC
jgi:hypothetical protein